MVDRPFRLCIVEKDPFVSADVAETFKRVTPQAECYVFSTVGEAREALDEESQPDLVFVSADMSGKVAVTAADIAWVESLRVIAVDMNSRHDHPEWFHLGKPFSEEELEAAFQSFGFQIQQMRAGQ